MNIIREHASRSIRRPATRTKTMRRPWKSSSCSIVSSFPNIAVASKAMATEYFYHLSEWQVVICKEYRYAVWPGQVKGHLINKQHGVSSKRAVVVSEEISEWPGVARYPSQFCTPAHVDEAVDELPVYNDGIKCELYRGDCRYVCRSILVIKEYWRKVHGFSAG